ncbi:PulJ/GspJ family protein [Halalkalibacter nanhaiisediminis]|uniref:Prepilin-type N-terminal cleavage/methylation domain-containing protein n=1 Tax=Halalkalibacter nanhaiisediminis TaxID=688079 RepID=A0A562QK18_9BACI|nr:prepilin-type N-terminal cleavage/methylation domain-containing protein [Halalkalibacter nanhaiisediminis]TWI57089.1 prepilin-type N-terminal cleavage/methylation domain-containing protein [Halalkalibacter nanhaiisediminis]
MRRAKSIRHDQNGLTLIELLLAISISAIITVVASQVLVQAFTSQATVKLHNDLRQEANIITRTLSSTHEQNPTKPYTISIDNHKGEQVLSINGHLTNSAYDIELIIKQESGQFVTLDTSDSVPSHLTIRPEDRILYVEQLRLVSKINSDMGFETSTIIKRVNRRDFRDDN